MTAPSRGEVWSADLGKGRGHEQSGQRPVLVVSVDALNHGPAGLAFVLPTTTKARGVPAHVPVAPPEGGLRSTSYILCDAIRSVSHDRLSQRWGVVSDATLAAVEHQLRRLQGL